LTDDVRDSALNWTQTFKSSAFIGLGLSELSDNFTHGGVTASLVGDTLTLTWAGTSTADGVLTASYSFTAAVPEPSSAVIAVLATLPLALRRRLRTCQAG